MKRFNPWWIIVVLSLFATNALAEKNESVGFVGTQHHYNHNEELMGVTIFTCEACASINKDTSYLVFEDPEAVRVYYSAVSHDFVMLPLDPDIWVRQKVVNIEDAPFWTGQQPHKRSEVSFLGSVGTAGSSGYETPIVGTIANVNLRASDRFEILVSTGWDPRARKVGIGDGWSRNYGAGLRTYFKKEYFFQFNVSRTEQFTSKWQKQATWVGGGFGYKSPMTEARVGIYQDIESFNKVFAITYGIRWYFPLNRDGSWGLVAGVTGSISRFNQQRDGEWLRLSAASMDGLGGLFFRF